MVNGLATSGPVIFDVWKPLVNDKTEFIQAACQITAKWTNNDSESKQVAQIIVDVEHDWRKNMYLNCSVMIDFIIILCFL